MNFFNPKWSMRFVEHKGYGVSWNFEKAPNLFHRIMQRIVLGIIWEKLP